jgi:hypothetical protein
VALRRFLTRSRPEPCNISATAVAAAGSAFRRDIRHSRKVAYRPFRTGAETA